MSGLSSSAIRFSVGSGFTETTANLKTGDIVLGRVVSRETAGDVLEIHGQPFPARLPTNVSLGSSLSLRIIEIGDGEVQAQILGLKSPAIAPGARVSGSIPAPQIRLDAATLQTSRALASASQNDLASAYATLRELGVPATAVTLAAALPHANSPLRLTTALFNLDALLAELPSTGKIATLRTLASFFASIDPEQTNAPGQLAGFVDQIAAGSEAKLVALLTALEGRVGAAPLERLLLTARATERAGALALDLKVRLAAARLEAVPESDVAAALTEVLEAMTASQLTSLAASREAAGAMAFVLPITTGKRTRSAQISVRRDGPSGADLDASNFSVSFFLETAHLGILAIGLDSKQSAIHCTVRTETQAIADRLTATIDRLRARLVRLGFSIASVSIAPVDQQRPLPTVKGEISSNMTFDTRV